MAKTHTQIERAYTSAREDWYAARDGGDEAAEATARAAFVAASSDMVDLKCARQFAAECAKRVYKPLWARARTLHDDLRAWGAGRGGDAQSVAYTLAAAARELTQTTDPDAIKKGLADVEKRAGLLMGAEP